ncbi:hypothetical protein K456DRAFT_50706 [Colletotrichum gloeosporioides 23]|nr:hypothetical protein K456DRAFT_50706 [Colletotrichum gloeosporioides 23]
MQRMQAGLSSPHLMRLILHVKHPVRTLGLLALLRLRETAVWFGILVVLPLILEMGTIGSNGGGFQLMGRSLIGEQARKNTWSQLPRPQRMHAH